MGARHGAVDAIEVAGWTLLAFVLWLCTLGSVDLGDLLVAAPTSLLTALLAWHSRRALRGRWRLRSQHLLLAAKLPLAAIAQAPGVLALPWRRGGRGGRLRRLPAGLTGRTSGAAGDRAMAEWLVSFPSGSYAVDVDPSDGELLVHELVAAGPDLASMVGR